MPAETKVPITPETKVHDLLSAYPNLEDLLVEISPAFARLRNPVLRRTVARVTSLHQAARVGGVSVGILINRLRQAVGQDALATEGQTGNYGPGERPGWCRPERIARRLDVRSIIDRGEKPMGPVLEALRHLEAGQICEVSAPFLPAPLIDLAREKGFETWWEGLSGDMVRVYFGRGGSGTSESLVGLEP